MGKKNQLAAIVLTALFALDALVWYGIFSEAPRPDQEALHFLNVGQGDAVLAVLPGGIKILTDAGPDSRVRRSLEEILTAGDRYIDLAVISHPQADHFAGFEELLRSYEFGAFLWNGREADGGTAGWQELMAEIQKRNIPLITVSKGDNIRFTSAIIQILSPNRALLQSAELNDTALVQMLQAPSFKFLSTADASLEIERRLAEEFDLRADILKVGHHGSKYASGEGFLDEVRPRLAIISAGRGNRYGHPAPETLARLKATGAAVLRTDEDGTISIFAENGKLKVYNSH